jgi:hypothetical protein
MWSLPRASPAQTRSLFQGWDAKEGWALLTRNRAAKMRLPATLAAGAAAWALLSPGHLHSTSAMVSRHEHGCTCSGSRAVFSLRYIPVPRQLSVAAAEDPCAVK